MKKILTTVSLLIILLSGIIHAQNRKTESWKGDILRDVCEKLEKYYTFPEMGKKISKAILDKLKKGDFSGNLTPGQLIEELNKVFYKISYDKHLKLIYAPKEARRMNESESEDAIIDS